MKEQKLISMTEFVLEQSKDWFKEMDKNREMIHTINKYAKFLSQPLTLGMFVPCVNGEVLEEPIKPMSYGGGWQIEMHKYEVKKQQFQQAQSRVLFEGVGYFKHNNTLYFGEEGLTAKFTEWMTVEWMMNEFNRCEITLTQNAIKTIYG